MQHHLPWLGTPAVRGLVCPLASLAARPPCGGGEVEGELVAGDLAGGERAADVEGLGRPQRPQLLCPLARAASRSRASARSSSPWIWLVPSKETCWCSMVKCRPSAALAASAAAWSGMNRAMASATSRSSAAIPIRCANGATWASTNAAASRAEPDGGLGDPAGAPGLEVTGLHPGPAAGQPVLQLDRGRDHCTAGVGGAADRERELGDAELRHQRCALAGEWEAGVAGGLIQVDASAIDSGGCCSAQVTAAVMQVGLRPVRCGLALAGEHQHVARGVELREGGAGG